jgi:ketosteroid isomerase-like protein
MKTLGILGGLIALLTVAGVYVWAGPDDQAIEQVMQAHARACSDFPRTRDAEAVLKYFSKDFSGVHQGEPQTYADVEKMLADLNEQLELGAPVGVSLKYSNIVVQAIGPLAWATYDQSFRMGVGGAVRVQTDSKCTSIFRKQGTTWLIQHDHCSSSGRRLSGRYN